MSPSQESEQTVGADKILTNCNGSKDIYGQCEIKVKSIVKDSYNSDWFKIRVAPDVVSQSKQLKKNDVIAKVLISTQKCASSKMLSKNNDQKIEQRAGKMEQIYELEYVDQDSFSDDIYRDSQESLNTLFCNTFRSGAYKPTNRQSNSHQLVSSTYDDSLVTYKTKEIQNDKNQFLFPEEASSNFDNCLSCFKSNGQMLSVTSKQTRRPVRYTPRRGALRQRCQDCGACLDVPEGIYLHDDDYVCDECRNEGQDNESIAIKIPVSKHQTRGQSHDQRVSRKFIRPSTSRAQPKQLKSFYHEEIEQFQMQL